MSCQFLGEPGEVYSEATVTHVGDTSYDILPVPENKGLIPHLEEALRNPGDPQYWRRIDAVSEVEGTGRT